MYSAIAIVFVLGYLGIALEHKIRLDKAATAVLTAVLCWVILMFGKETILGLTGELATKAVEGSLMHHLGEIAGILFFLLGAMTIVELVDSHSGFDLITSRIKTVKKSRLLWMITIIAFFMSAVLDNMTTAIVMAALIRKIISEKKDLWIFGGMIILAANAGGAWSPIGDVTTIMLWIGGQVTASKIVLSLFIPSVISILVPLLLISRKMKGDLASSIAEDHRTAIPDREKKIVLYVGIAALLFVPIFKSVTHLPPFLGILFGLAILWMITEYLHHSKSEESKKALSIGGVLQRIDTPSILFFLGILLAVGVLQTAGHLAAVAGFLDTNIGDIWVINTLIGLVSSVVDNVPLVAGAMGMYSIEMYPADHTFWVLLAYCAGTGGSCLIIGSAAGVAIMGILKIDFIWYLKNITLYAVIGYLAGVASFFGLSVLLGQV